MKFRPIDSQLRKRFGGSGSCRTAKHPRPHGRAGARPSETAPATQPRAAVLLLLTFLLARPAFAAEPLTARAAVETQRAYVGESFRFEIQVNGHDTPAPPDLAGLEDFAVTPQGGGPNNQTSISIVNGRMSKVVKRGYVFRYLLTPEKAGLLTIPAITVKADKRAARTQPVQIRALQPAETNDFKLRVELSTEKCYVGQPVTLTVTWYIGKHVQDFRFRLPWLADERFAVASHGRTNAPDDADDFVAVEVGEETIYARKARGALEGTDYLTVRFQQVLLPRAPGRFALPQATVALQAVVGYKRSRDPFDDFFGRDFPFGSHRRAVLRKVVVPANQPTLFVRALPLKGRPDAFSGLVGQYSLAAQAKPTEVRVGDPITLTLQVTGPDYLDNVRLPPLHEQPALARDFKVPEERAEGKVEGPVKTFTQTLRAKHPDVERIPPIELPYFDAVKGRYAVAKSRPLPLDVSAARVVTAADAEGASPVTPAQRELKTLSAGLRENYEDLSVLEDQAHGPTEWVRSPLWLALLGVPPLAYVLLLATVTAVRRRRADPASLQARRALGACRRALQAAEREAGSRQTEAVLRALQQYLGSKLRLPPGALTFRDVAERLRAGGVPEETLDELRALMQTCEESRYAGGATADQANLAARARAVAASLERRLRG